MAEPGICIETADSNEAGREVVRRTCDALLESDGPREVQLFAVGALSAAAGCLAAAAGVQLCLKVLDELRASVLRHGHLIDGRDGLH